MFIWKTIFDRIVSLWAATQIFVAFLLISKSPVLPRVWLPLCICTNLSLNPYPFHRSENSELIYEIQIGS